ncbi:glycoside hydrolase family 127 protein [Chondrinema litorale]|uniref:glycoside hydrolase family 127 protein n=1 Tax=Chondrinema litorale TaxID=2994555 RepID=UPI00254334D7|nr:glycoside hydrolase family 127 protein [Chondrinema litorale]UZR98478.1 glycoside hydrolase family 127 protein [Chondrinema litorale]
MGIIEIRKMNTYRLILSTIAIILFTQCAKRAADGKVSEKIISQVPFSEVKVQDLFWSPRIETNRKVTIPFDFQKCQETGRLDNFAIAAGLKSGKFKGKVYDDSDVFKVIEGASYSWQQTYDPELDAYLDSLINWIASAQEPDGYLYTARTINSDSLPDMGGSERWQKIHRFSHELYNVGHMYEAAVAHYQTTNKRDLLDVAIKNADLICKTFGPGKLMGVPGHQEIEIGLVRLYKVTGDEKYLDMAEFFIDQRGNAAGHTLSTCDDNIYYAQDHVPLVRQNKAVGHAVRAGYFYTGIADVASITKDKSYINAIDKIWSDVATSKLYLTGGIGSVRHGEAFGNPYDLPNENAYNETCAAVVNMLWNHRMFLLHGESKYMDVFERTLYNGFLSGVSLSGDRFFYPNKLLCKSDCQREPWFETSCCPSNVVRFMPSISGYIYAQQDKDIFINLFIGSTTQVGVADKVLTITQRTDHPWDGNVNLVIETEAPVEAIFRIRLPGWAVNQPVPSDLYNYLKPSQGKIELLINDLPVDYKMEYGYAVVERAWQNNDIVTLNLPMEVKTVIANSQVKEDSGKVAFERGPVVYCFEGIDNEGQATDIKMSSDVSKDYAFESDFLQGIGRIVFKDKFHQSLAIPYYARANRGESDMTVWVPISD